MKRIIVGLASAAVAVGIAGVAVAAPTAHADSLATQIAGVANGSVAIARGATMLNTDDFGEYGCEDYVDAAYGRTVANGIPHNGAIAYYDALAAKGLGHTTLPAPPGALVFSQGEDGGHVDISLGDGHYLSGGVQGFAPGWGSGKDIQVLPSANLGNWQLVGWAYAPWSSL